MTNDTLMMDEIRKRTLLHFIEQQHGKTRKPAHFRYEGDGLRFITDQDTVINDWTPQQVEQALRDLEASRQVEVSYRPHGSIAKTAFETNTMFYDFHQVPYFKAFDNIMPS